MCSVSWCVRAVEADSLLAFLPSLCKGARAQQRDRDEHQCPALEWTRRTQGTDLAHESRKQRLEPERLDETFAQWSPTVTLQRIVQTLDGARASQLLLLQHETHEFDAFALEERRFDGATAWTRGRQG